MAFRHERPDDLTEREAWAWAEVEFCQRMADSLREMIPSWTNKPGEHSSKYEGAMRCSISAECWEQLAWHLRNPYDCRKECEAYEAQTTPEPAGKAR